MSLTPTEDLIMEVLAARWRLGENLWTFSSRTGRAARSLEHRGLVRLMHGIVENTYRAAMTEDGKAAYLDSEYVPKGAPR